MADRERGNAIDGESFDERASTTPYGWQSDNMDKKKIQDGAEENVAANAADEDEDGDCESDSGEDELLEAMEEGEGAKWGENSVQPLCLAFENISYTVKVSEGGGIKGCCGRITKKENPFKKVNKVVLCPMSGHFLYVFEVNRPKSSHVDYQAGALELPIVTPIFDLSCTKARHLALFSPIFSARQITSAFI